MQRSLSRIASMGSGVVGVLVLLALAACVESAPRVSDDMLAVAHRQDPGVMPEQLMQGREAYLRHCDSCHDLPAITSHSVSAWPRIVESMSKRSALTRGEHDDLLRYVMAARQAEH